VPRKSSGFWSYGTWSKLIVSCHRVAARRGDTHGQAHAMAARRASQLEDWPLKSAWQWQRLEPATVPLAAGEPVGMAAGQSSSRATP